MSPRNVSVWKRAFPLFNFERSAWRLLKSAEIHYSSLSYLSVLSIQCSPASLCRRCCRCLSSSVPLFKAWINDRVRVGATKKNQAKPNTIGKNTKKRINITSQRATIGPFRLMCGCVQPSVRYVCSKSVDGSPLLRYQFKTHHTLCSTHFNHGQFRIFNEFEYKIHTATAFMPFGSRSPAGTEDGYGDWERLPIF